MSLFRDALRNSNLTNFFTRDPRAREVKETEALLWRAREAFSRSRWANEDTLPKFLAGIIIEACDRFELAPSSPLGDALVGFVQELAASEPFFTPPLTTSVPDLTIEQAMQLRRSSPDQVSR